MILVKLRQQKKATDIHGRSVTPYPEATEILEELKAAGIVLGVASRTTEIKGARKLIEALGWDKYLTHKEIFPGCKITHFNNLTASSKIPLEDMLFFDDEMRNIRDLTSHGVVCKEVKDGVNRNEVKKGLINFENIRTSKWSFCT